MQSISEKDRSIIISILDCITKIKSYILHFNNVEEFNNNYLVFDATVMNFVVIGEMVAKLSNEFQQTYTKIDWRNIIGFRNIIAHDYFGIDAEEVWEIIHTDLNDLEIFLKLIF